MRRSVVIPMILLTIALGIGFTLSLQPESDATGNNDINQVLQNAVMSDLDGEEVTLRDYEGKVVLIDIWETWCTPCLQSFPTLQRLMEDYPDDFIVLAVSPGYMDTPEQVRTFIDNNEYDFEFVFGEALSRDLKVQSIPYKVYVSPEGEHITSIRGTQGPEEDYAKTREIIESYL